MTKLSKEFIKELEEISSGLWRALYSMDTNYSDRPEDCTDDEELEEDELKKLTEVLKDIDRKLSRVYDDVEDALYNLDQLIEDTEEEYCDD